MAATGNPELLNSSSLLMEEGLKPRLPRMTSQDGLIDVADLIGEDHLLSSFAQRVKAADTNGDGRLSRAEFRAVFDAEVKGAKRIRQLKAMLITAIVACVVIIGANVGLAVATAHLARNTDIAGDSGVMTVKGSSVAVGTASTVAITSDLTQFINDDGISAGFVKAIRVNLGNVTRYLQVASVNIVEGQSVSLDTVTGEILEVDAAGLSTFFDKNGNVVPQATQSTGRRLSQFCGGCYYALSILTSRPS